MPYKDHQKVVECNRRWRHRNPQKMRSCRKKWNDANPDKLKAAIREWAILHPDKVREKSRRWYATHKEKVRIARLNYRKANAEKIQEQQRRQRIKHRVKILARNMRRHSLLLNAPQGTPWTDWVMELSSQPNYCCYWCRRRLPTKTAKHNERLTIDHLQPISKGGVNGLENLVSSCQGCNSCKNNKTHDEFVLCLQRSEHPLWSSTTLPILVIPAVPYAR